MNGWPGDWTGPWRMIAPGTYRRPMYDYDYGEIEHEFRATWPYPDRPIRAKANNRATR